jgi:chemotaxis response regulator CheB
METEPQESSGQLQPEGVEDSHLTEQVVAIDSDTESKPGPLPFPVVGIGASAGGVEAFIDSLPG